MKWMLQEIWFQLVTDDLVPGFDLRLMKVLFKVIRYILLKSSSVKKECFHWNIILNFEWMLQEIWFQLVTADLVPGFDLRLMKVLFKVMRYTLLKSCSVKKECFHWNIILNSHNWLTRLWFVHLNRPHKLP